MKSKSVKEFIASGMLKGSLALGALLSFAVFPEEKASENAEKSYEVTNKESGSGEVSADKVTTEWNDTYLFSSREDASEELEKLNKKSQEINETFRPKFEKLSGHDLLGFLESEKEYSKSLEVLYTYAHTQLSKNVNEPFFISLVGSVQDLFTEYKKARAFATVKLTSLGEEEWDRLFSEEPGLEAYRAYLAASYIRFSEHRPVNETQAMYLAELENQRMKLETEALSQITNKVTRAGEITLENGEKFSVNSQSYNTLLSTDPSRENRKRCYDKRFYHLIKESESMASLYCKKARIDDLVAGELKYADFYDYTLYNLYLTRAQIDDMNAVFKQRKGIFEDYNEFRRNRLGLEALKPYDLMLQLTNEPGKKYAYIDAVREIEKSYSGMDPNFKEIFFKMVTGSFIDVYPDPEHGKQPGGYCTDSCALKAPPLIFMNYDGLIRDQKTLTHELGHAVNFYLMGNSVDYLYCSGTIYEMEIPSTFNEELLVDHVVESSDKDTAIAVLSQQIDDYQNFFTRQPLITEFEYRAHRLCAEKETVTGVELNAIWTSLSKEYRSPSVEYYPEDSAEWTYINHIYLTSNYYTFNYSVSKAITLALFKQYGKDPETFNKNYIAYLSAGSTMPPEAKLIKYFGIEINRQLFEDAMDVVESRIRELYNLAKK
ncbi:M3 family oligoendopeptidase [Methanosarcina sp. MSH10X1]|uniref:M3 family oligoendopeptidase n=1 Tax=Methanosarcina sp. MSH10X1 TaxID=2507075 RepID=UPI001F0C27DC|nr:M3 family oligoendopeptidase [Methanosarcina sp. MSH10X1]